MEINQTRTNCRIHLIQRKSLHLLTSTNRQSKCTEHQYYIKKIFVSKRPKIKERASLKPPKEAATNSNSNTSLIPNNIISKLDSPNTDSFYS